MQEREARAEKAKARGKVASSKQQASLLRYMRPTTGDVESALPNELVEVPVQRLKSPPFLLKQLTNTLLGGKQNVEDKIVK